MAKFFLPNPGFELGDRDWLKFAGTVIENDAVNARSGSWVTRAATTGTGISNGDFNVRPGHKISASIWSKHTSNFDAFSRMQIQWFDKDVGFISSPVGNNVAAGTTVYTQSTIVNAIAPDRSKLVRIRPFFNNGTVGDAWFDDAEISGDIIETIPMTAEISGHRIVPADTIGVFDPLIGADKFTEFNAGMSDKWAGVYNFIPSIGADLGELVSFIRRLGRTERFFAFDPDRTIPLNGIVNGMTVDGPITIGTNKIPVLFVPDDLTLLYEFAKNRSLSAQRGLGPTLTFVRATVATFFGSDGLLQTAASGVARFDHNPVSLVSLGLLVEEVRTNLCLRSEEIENAAWLDSGTITVTADQSASPDGTTTMDKLDSGVAANNDRHARQQPIAGAAINDEYIVSAFYKADLGDGHVRLLEGGDTPWHGVTANLNTGVIDLTTGVDASGIVDVGGGIFRVWFKATRIAAGSFALYVGPVPAGMATPQSTYDPSVTGQESCFCWGAQLENNSTFLTTYIKTTTASVTRNADVVSTTDVSWLNEGAGTFYAAATKPFDTGSAQETLLELNISNGNNDKHFLNKSTIGASRYRIKAGGVEIVTLAIANVWGVTNDSRIGLTFAANDVEHFVDGVRSGTGDQLATLPTGLNTFNVGNALGGQQFWNGHIKELRYYNVRKANQFLEDLSNGIISNDPANSPALVAGDYIEVKDQYFQLQRDLEIGPEGTGEAIVFPAVRSTLANGEDVITNNPKMVARITSDLDWRRVEARPVELSISWEEV